MKILVIARFFPYAEVTHSSGTDLYHYITSLTERGHQISLASFILDWERPHLDSMRRYCSEINTVPAISSFSRRIAKAPMLCKFPREWVETYSPYMRRVIEDMVNRNKYDLVHFQHLWSCQYLHLVSGCRTVLDDADTESLVLLRRYRRERNILKKLYLFYSWVRATQIEMEFLQKIDLTLARSEKDKYYLLCLSPGINIRILAPWFKGLDHLAFSTSCIEKHSLLFAGYMGRDLNIEAVQFFCDKVFPYILKEVPDARFYIVGDAPPDRIKNLADDHVVITGYVEDFYEYYAHCQVFVAPLQVGGGIIVKILNALAAGRPVVCTPQGNEGIEAVPDRDLFVASTPELFAEKVIKLLTDPDCWNRLASNGRKFFEQKYSWPRIVDDLENAYKELINIH